MKNYLLKELILDLMIGLGFILVISPAILYWFIHGDYDRYVWIISGPYPFSHLGGGPFQLFTYAGLLMIGISLIVIGMMEKTRRK